MTDSRTRLDQRIAGLGPDILAPELDERAFLRRLRADDPTRADRRRPARPADHRRDRQPVEGGGLLRGRDRPVAAHRRRLRRGGARDRPRHAPADAGVRAATGCRSASRSSTASPAARARAAATPRTSAHAGRATTIGRHTGAHGVSAETDRPQGRGPDRPGQHARLVRRRAGQHGVDMIEFDVLPEHQHAPDDGPAAARPRLRARRRRADARGGPRPPRERARSTASSSTSTSSSPATRSAWSQALREHGLVERTLISSNWMRSLIDAARARAEAAARLVGPAPANDPTQRWLTKLPAYAGAAYMRVKLPRRRQGAHGGGPLRRADGALAARHAAAGARRCARPAASSTCGRSTTAARIARLEQLGVTGVITNDPRLFAQSPSTQVAAE